MQSTPLPGVAREVAMAGMSDVTAAAAFAGYRLFGLVVRPLVPLILSRRVARGKEDIARSAERYGIASRPRPSGRVVWVHAASVGETNAVLPLIAQMNEAGFAIVLTTTTLTSAMVASRRLPSGAAHQFAPLDIGPFVRRFLAHWQPDLAVLVESELWPVKIRQLRSAGIPLAIVNGKLSERSFRGWSRFTPAARLLLSDVTLCLAQSERDGERFKSLGAPSVTVTGNLKFDAPAPPADQASLEAFRTMVGARPVWVAASTHDGEEAMVVAAHKALAARHQDLLTVIVPRHPERGAAIRSAALSGCDLGVAQRSLGEPVVPSTGIYLADTLGELGLFYRAGRLAFMGGSLVPHGGQNPIEPTRVGIPVVHGPHVHNFVDVYRALDGGGEAATVHDVDDLVEFVATVLDDPGEASQRADAARAAISQHAGALKTTMAELEALLGGVEPDAESA